MQRMIMSGALTLTEEEISWNKTTIKMNRQTDRLVEVFDACAAHVRRFTAIRLGMFRENRRQGAAQQLRCK
jgi:hypothetical protein